MGETGEKCHAEQGPSWHSGSSEPLAHRPEEAGWYRERQDTETQAPWPPSGRTHQDSQLHGLREALWGPWA